MGLFDFLKVKRVVTPETNKASRNDDYAIAAFIRISQDGACIKKSNDDYARYFIYDFHVNNPIKFHKQVIQNGFLEEAEPDVALRKMHVPQLKEILNAHGISDKGKKEELIARIIESVDIHNLKLESYFVPSQKGWEHLKKYEYIFSLKQYGISYEQYEKAKSKMPQYAKTNDVIWHIINENFNAYNVAGDFGLARNEILNRARLLQNEKRYKDALLAYIITLYYDASGCGNNRRIDKAESIVIPPGIIKEIFELQEHYDVEMIKKCYSTYKLPHHYISKEKFAKLIDDIFEDEVIEFRKYT